MGDLRPKEPIFGYTGPVARILAACILTAGITAVVVSLPERSPEWIRSQELVRKLYLLPILLSAAWFGGRGAAIATAGATLVCMGLIGSPFPDQLPAQVERVGEVGVFWLVGALSANFFEQQRKFLQDIETANDNTLLALASSLDVREHDTGLHSLRVANYTLRLARELEITDRDELEATWRGALLHDVGKIGIPDRVLLKPGPLTAEEWKVMRTHPEVGARILSKIEFLRRPAEIVVAHHEWYDGSGYPRGLAAERIPLAARMFAVIDVYDALTTDRSYHLARSYADALQALREGAGTHFDPAVVEAFARIPLEELRGIARHDQASLLLGPESAGTLAGSPVASTLNPTAPS
jgi:putative nucleotidyltransferase with HDIG domain